jgi:hypothetical protein
VGLRVGVIACGVCVGGEFLQRGTGHVGFAEAGNGCGWVCVAVQTGNDENRNF